MVLLAFNFIISLNITEDLIHLCSLKQNLKQIMIFVKSGIGNQQFDTPITGRIIREIARYETALAYTSTMLDSKYFNKINNKKAADWEEFKKRYFTEEKEMETIV